MVKAKHDKTRKCTLCSCNANPRRLQRQSCSGWHHTFSRNSALHKWGWIFHRDIIFCDTRRIPAYSSSAGNNPNSDPYPWPFEPKINRLGWTLCWGLLLCQVPNHSAQGFSFYHAKHTHNRTHIVKKWSHCQRLRTTSSARITRIEALGGCKPPPRPLICTSYNLQREAGNSQQSVVCRELLAKLPAELLLHLMWPTTETNH